VTFQRARTAQQREERRDTILAAARAMAAEMPLDQLSLNQLSRRAGLAKSNVLRYFESREAVLIELLDDARQDWLDAVALGLRAIDPGDSPENRRARLVAMIAGSLAERDSLCELLSASATVLERHISPTTAARYKRATAEDAARLGLLITGVLPELSSADGEWIAGVLLLVIGPVWAHARPSPAVRAAYVADPGLAPIAVDLDRTVRDLLDTVLTGRLARSGPDHE
jgi:AcrR family transcriptional regulator